MKNFFLNKQSIVCIALLFIFVVALTACSSSSNQTEKNAEEKEDVEVKIDDNKIVAEGKEGKVTVLVDEDMDWSEEIPDYIPEFTYGKIIGMQKLEMNNENGFSVIAQDIEKEAGEKYKNDLESAGYKIINYSKIGNIEMIVGENDKATVTANFMYEDNTGAVNIIFKD